MERTNLHIADINSKTIFKNDFLCAQFIRDNIDIPILKNVQPEDLEDVTDRFTSYFGVEYSADTVKRVKIHIDEEEESFYLISLIDHKSDVDYNVSMQLLKYMACIWAEYEKTFLDESGKIIRNKSFRYPPIIPVVYYEGEKEWTADIHLRDRVMFSDILRPYIPDFKYIVVRNHDFSDEELLSREDEMSLLMMINKFQTADDISNFKQISSEKIDAIIQNSSEQVIDIIAAVVYSLCSKIHISAEETDEAVQKVREHKLGYLFENMEKIDIQELRRAADEERQKVEELKKISDEEHQKAEEYRKITEAEREKAEAEREKAEAEREKAEAEREKAEAEREKAEAEREKAEAADIRFKKAAISSLKLFFSDTDIDMAKLQSAINNQTNSDLIISWLDRIEQPTDKTALYNEIIGGH